MFRQIVAAIALTTVATLAAAKDGPPSVAGSALYQQFCSSCHDHPRDRIPARDLIAKRTPDEVMRALTNGLMRTQAAGLAMNDRVAVATFLTGKAPTDNMGKGPEENLCTTAGVAAVDTGPAWNGWGPTSRQLPLSARSRLFRGRSAAVEGQVGVRVPGDLHLRSTHCGRWPRVCDELERTRSIPWMRRPVVSTGRSMPRPECAPQHPLSGWMELPAGGWPLFLGTIQRLSMLDAHSGKLIWTKNKLDAHPDARITGAPVFHKQTLYVPVSSLEELSAPAPGYECCKFRGSVAA